MPKAGSSRVRETFKLCSIIAVTAIVVALAVPAAVNAAGSFVTIEDADSTNRAQVDNGKLRVGDGVGNPNSLTVNGHVTSRAAALADLKRFFGVKFPGAGCSALASPATGKALVITNIMVDTYINPSPGAADRVGFYVGTSCSGIVADVNPSGIGVTNVDLGPGITVPNGMSLFVDHMGENESEIYVFGYQVAASQVPAASAESEAPASPPRQP